MTEGAQSGAQGARALSVELFPVDRMLLAFLAGLAAIAAATHPQPMPLVAACAGLAGAVVVAAAWGARDGTGRVVHDFAPLPVTVAIFGLCGPVIEHANPARWDGALAALDARFFGPLVAAWRDALGRPPLLTDAASLAYVSYYFIPLAMAIALHLRGRRAEFQDLAFTMVATLLVSYASYFLLPARGPRVPPHLQADVLGGGEVSAAVRAFVARAEGNRLDAFPSAHTALSLVFLAKGWRLLPRWRAPLALAVASIVFSTVYLSWHYAVDIVAGALLAALMIAALPLLRWTFGLSPARGAS